MSEKIATILGLMLPIAALLTIPLWGLWNWLMPIIFGLPEINLIQALGLMILSGLLFKSNSTS